MSTPFGYPATLCARARRMAHAGFSVSQIRRLFERDGIDPLPSVSTIKRWLCDEEAERRLIESKRIAMAKRRAEQHGGRLIRVNTLSEEFREARLRALVETCGLSPADAAAVMAFDAPDHPLSPGCVARALGLDVDDGGRGLSAS